mmetsp:Transcript_12216/g.49043  ORF Transcript_12216/g.49043 Transcript_12216/m.49043 type:complete len:302 (-) Transcript_12216:356-1261(-)
MSNDVNGMSVMGRLAGLRNTCQAYPVLTSGTIEEIQYWGTAIGDHSVWEVKGTYFSGVYNPPVVFKGIMRSQRTAHGVRPPANPDCSSTSLLTSDITLDEAVAAWEEVLSTPEDEYGNFGADVICSYFKRNGNGFRCFDKPKPPATKELAIERYASEYPPETICAPLKQNSPFQCKPKTKPPTTKELAIQRYASEYPAETICAPLKLNSPFQCTRNVEVPATTRLSLSVAAAQAVFAVSGIILVALLRKLSKPAETSSGDDELRSVVRKLRITVDKLDSKVDQLGTGHSEHEELIQKLLKK